MSIQNRMTAVLSVTLLAICAPVTAQPEANKALIRDRWLPMMQTADQTIANEIYAPGFTCHAPHYPQAGTLAGYRVEVIDAGAVVGDWQVVLEDLITEGDRVVGRFTASGKMPPAGIFYTNTWIIFYRFEDGKIAEEWWEYDLLGVQQQMGAIPTAPEGPPAMQRTSPEAFTWGTPSDVIGDPGDPETNKAMFRRELDAWNQGDVDALLAILDEIYAPEFVYHDPARPHVTDLASYKQWAAEECFGAFPGFRMPVEDMIAESDRVAARWAFTGTHVALGRPVVQTGMTIARIADGKIVEAWCACDMLGTIVQLTTPTEDELLAIADAAGEAINAHNLDAFTSFFTEDGVFDLVPFGMVFTGAEQIKAVMAGEFEAFPDWHITKPDMLAGPGIVVSEYTIGGTHQGMWNGIPPTGNAVQLPAMEIIDFEGDKIKRLTIYTDVLSEMIQLGVMPEPEMPPLVPSFTLPDAEATGLSPMEANAELLARWNTHDLGEFAKMLTADVAVYEGGFGVPMGRAECIAAHEMLLAAFPDAVGHYVRQTDLGDGWVVVEVDLTSTHNGPFMGIPPTGRPVTLRTGGLRHFNADGLVDYFALYYDLLGVMQLLTAVAPVDPGRDALVAYYPLDGDASDASGHGLDGVAHGDPTAISGAVGGAMEFDGDGDMIEIAADAALDITGPISLSLWIRPDAEDPEGQGTETAPMAKAFSTASPSWSWQVRYGWASPKPYMAFTFNTSPRAWAYVNENLAQGEWHHIACSADGQTLTAYLNGLATESTPMGAITSSPAPVLIGSDGWSCDWIGAIDEVAIYNRALSADEMLYLAGFRADTGQDPSLSIYYSFDEFGEIVPDESGNGNDGAVVGDVTGAAEGAVNAGAKFANAGYLDLDGANVAAEDIPTSGMTLAAWIQCENTGDHHALFNARASDQTWVVHPEARSNGEFRWLLRAYGGTTVFDVRAGAVTWGEWQHFVATYDKASAKAAVYTNGELASELDVANPADIAGDWGMGARVGKNIDDARPFTGLMDEFRLFTRALSQDEIVNLVAGM